MLASVEFSRVAMNLKECKLRRVWVKVCGRVGVRKQENLECLRDHFVELYKCLQNDALIANPGFDPADNERRKGSCHWLFQGPRRRVSTGWSCARSCLVHFSNASRTDRAINFCAVPPKFSDPFAGRSAAVTTWHRRPRQKGSWL